MNIAGIIPARFASSRFPGKPLADIHGKPMIQWVYERASLALDVVAVATDDERIAQVVRAFGGKVVMTRADHENGTSRCLEAIQILAKDHSIGAVINIQGDEPMLAPEQLLLLKEKMKEPGVQMATLVIPVRNAGDLLNDSEVFVTIDRNGKALYFSRAVIPVIRDVKKRDWLEHHTFYKHVGLYGFRLETLEHFCNLPMSSLEKAECLEQNRWLEAGQTVHVAITEHESIPVDTQEDLDIVRRLWTK